MPYGDTSLPAMFVHAEPANKSGKVPAMVFFDGLDVTKEIQYFKGVADLAARGIACLIVDGPGNGESIRFRNLYLRPDTEHYATPVFDYLAARPEVDPKRIGVMAISLGGYYAPRAAAFEQRFACCIAWGAQWDYRKIWADRFERLARADTPSLSVAHEHIAWVLNVKTQDEVLKALEPFKLDGVVQKITCPFLMLHGEGDEQIPLPEAQKCFAAVGSKQKTFKLFTREEGGYHHCQIDNQSICSAYMWDWLEQVLQPRKMTRRLQEFTSLVDVDIVVFDHFAPASDFGLEKLFASGRRAHILRECLHAGVMPLFEEFPDRWRCR